MYPNGMLVQALNEKTSFQQISQAIEEKKEENERKKALIEEFRQIEEELKTVQREKEELDSEIESIFNHDPQDKVKKIGEE